MADFIATIEDDHRRELLEVAIQGKGAFRRFKDVLYNYPEMKDSDEDKLREERIQNEIIVDCYGEYEQAAGWYCYLDDMLTFPFEAECIGARSISPLKKGEHVRVIRMADQNDCLSEMFVMVEFMERTFGVPLVQLKPIKVGAQTQEAVEDWHYWVGQGHSF